MTKQKSHAVGDAKILAYLEGVASPDVTAQIEASTELLERAHLLAQAEARLRLFLAPGKDEEDLELLHPGTIEQARVEIARLFKPMRAYFEDRKTADSPMPVFVRGGPYDERDEQNPRVTKLAFEAGEVFIVLDIKPMDAGSMQFELQGYVLGWDEPEIQAQIWRENTLVSTVSFDTEDKFSVAKLPSGHYQVALITSKKRIVLEPFAIQ